VREIVWDDRAFDSLVLPPGYKDLILSFTANQNSTEKIVDDVIEGKGRAHAGLFLRVDEADKIQVRELCCC
jgi:hypothetical protein